MLGARAKDLLLTIGLCAFPSLFAAGITVNAAPSVVSLIPHVCPQGTELVTGSRGVPHARTGTEGFAECRDAEGHVQSEVLGIAFFGLLATFTLTLTLVVKLWPSAPVKKSGDRKR